MEQEYSKRKIFFLSVAIVSLIFCVFIISSPSNNREESKNSEPPSNYSFGTLTPIISLNTTTLIVNNETTAQIIYLGKKPLLRIENMNISNCSRTRLFLSTKLDFKDVYETFENDIIDLGPIIYYSGHSNYELPFNINVSKFNMLNVWCDSTNSTIGRAIFQ